MRVRAVRSDGCMSYVLVADGDAAIIDPARDTEKYHAVLEQESAVLRFVIDTHTHADHLSGARKLADERDSNLVMSARHVDQWRAGEGKADELGIGDVLRKNAGVHVDIAVRDGDTLELGRHELRFMWAPGHTEDSIVIQQDARAFTGDTLLIGQSGRCDLPGGDGAAMHETLSQRLAALPDETLIYPGHDYQGQTVSALGYERIKNPFLETRTTAEFVEFLKTAFPSLTGAGMQCGAATVACEVGAVSDDPLRDEVASFMDSYFFAPHRSETLMRPIDLKRALDQGVPITVLDVREPDEFADGHVEGAYNLSVHELDGRLAEIPAEPDDAIVAICRSGRRSGWATMFLRVAGFKDVRNVAGGMLDWTKEGLPIKRGSES